MEIKVGDKIRPVGADPSTYGTVVEVNEEEIVINPGTVEMDEGVEEFLDENGNIPYPRFIIEEAMKFGLIVPYEEKEAAKEAA